MKTIQKNTKKKKRTGAMRSKKYVTVKNSKPFTGAFILLLVVVIVAVSCFFTLRSNDDSKFFSTDAKVVQGVDVSEHNQDIDWEKLKSETDFAIIRVGYRSYGKGEIFEDETAKQNLKSAKKAEIPVGVYFYSQAVTAEEAEEEADFVIKTIKHMNVELPVFIDYEYAYGSDGQVTGRLAEANLSPEEATDILNAFCTRVTSAGYQAGVYASTYFYNEKLLPSQLHKDTVKWVADYNESITYTGDYDIWQYSKTGSLSGNGSKYIDLNYWYLEK